MTSTLDPSHKQIEMWRRATGSEGGLNEYRNWVLENSMRGSRFNRVKNHVKAIIHCLN